MIYNLFEQSGTFKKEEIKLGYKAVDVDILNNFNQTDYQVDLFDAIESAYEEKPGFFDKITEADLCFSFFPCTKFTEKIFVNAKCQSVGMKFWDYIKKVEYSMNFISKINYYYSLFCKMYAICLKRNLKMIIENPYPLNRLHFLDFFFPFNRTFIDKNRAKHYDYYVKPTGFWFVNFPFKETVQKIDPLKLKKNIAVVNRPRETLKGEEFNKFRKVELKSLIAPEYAEWFLKSFVVGNYEE